MNYIAKLGFVFFLAIASVESTIDTVGRPAELGLFYNSVQDEIIYVSSLKTHIPNGSSILLPGGKTECKFEIVRSTVDKLNSININLETQINILSGTVEARGAASFATNSNVQSDTVQGVLHYSTIPLYEALHTRLSSVQKLFSLTPGQFALDATDVIYEIGWGYTLTFVFEMQSTGNYTQDATQMEISVKPIATAINAKTEFKSEKGAQKSTFKINSYGDMVLPLIPQSVEDVYTILKQVPDMLNNSPSGKGIPQNFKIVSINNLQSLIDFDLHGIPIKKDNTTVNTTLLFSFQSDLMTIYWQKDAVADELASINFHVRKFNNIFNQTIIENVKTLQFKFTTTFNQFNQQFKQNLMEARTGSAYNAIKMLKINNEYLQAHSYGPLKVMAVMKQEYSFVKSKIVDYNIFKKYGITFLRNDWSITQILNDNVNSEFLFLFYKEQWKTLNSTVWRSISKQFIQMKGLKYIVDCDNEFHNTLSCLPETNRWSHNTFFLTKFKVDRKLNYHAQWYHHELIWEWMLMH